MSNIWEKLPKGYMLNIKLNHPMGVGNTPIHVTSMYLNYYDAEAEGLVGCDKDKETGYIVPVSSILQINMGPKCYNALTSNDVTSDDLVKSIMIDCGIPGDKFDAIAKLIPSGITDRDALRTAVLEAQFRC